MIQDSLQNNLHTVYRLFLMDPKHQKTVQYVEKRLWKSDNEIL